jgi:hypothetical protein
MARGTTGTEDWMGKSLRHHRVFVGRVEEPAFRPAFHANQERALAPVP